VSSNDNRGMSLAIVLAVLAILGQIIVAVIMSHGNAMKFSRESELHASARLASMSALDYVRYRVDSDTNPFRTDSLFHIPLDTTISYSINVRQRGLIAVVRATGNLQSGVRIIHDTVFAQIESHLPSNVALALMDQGAGLALAGSAQVVGDVMLRHGTVSKSDQARLPALKTAGLQGQVRDSTDTLWKSLRFNLAPVQTWLDSVAKIPVQHSAATTSMNADSFPCPRVSRKMGTVVVGGTGLIKGSMLVAEKIVVQDSVSLDGVLFCARELEIRTKANIVNGQFIALDTMLVPSAHPHGLPLFYVHGRTNIGYLSVGKYDGGGTFIFGGNQWTPHDGTTKATFATTTHIAGNVAINGWLDMGGAQVNGSVLAWNLVLDYDGTRWQGYMKDGKITAPIDGHTSFPDFMLTKIPHNFQKIPRTEEIGYAP